MRSFAPALLFAATSMASTLVVTNHCQNSVYLTLTNGSGSTTGPTELIASATYTEAIAGSGNSLGITTDSDFYSPNTAKLIIGTSTTDGTLYWSPSDVDGNPFASTGFAVNSPNAGGADVCGAANSPDGQTRGCPDGDFELEIDLCPTN